MLTIRHLFMQLRATYPRHVFDLQSFDYNESLYLVHIYSLFHILVDVVLSEYV